jgi:hypothetical protein
MDYGPDSFREAMYDLRFCVPRLNSETFLKQKSPRKAQGFFTRKSILLSLVF